MAYSKCVETLNEAQRHAATTIDGPVVIVAGPGTGKTKTLAERVRHLLASGVPGERILALTFTKKAAEEMQARIATPHVYVGTFHGLCFELLGQKMGHVPQFVTEPVRMMLIKKLAKPASLSGVPLRDIALRISRAKNATGDDPAIVSLITAYNAALREQNLSDFDDLLLQTRDLLQQDTAWRKQVQSRFSHILVDEFQDTNNLQYELLQLLRGTDNLCVIGDPLQSIYGFRGADGDIFGHFTRDFPAATRVTLSINYRSATSIVSLANAVYPDAPQLTPHIKEQGRVRAVEVLNEYSEAAWVLAQIERAIGGSDLQRAVSDDGRGSHYSLRDFAILYRNRSAARALQKAVVASGLPYQIVGDGSPYEDPAVQMIVQLLGRLTDPQKPVAIKDMTERQVQTLIETLDATARPVAVAEQVIRSCGLQTTVNLQQFCGTLVRFATIAEAVAYIDDIAAHGFYDDRADAVTLLTIHASKGLEFTHVFLAATEEGTLPSERGDEQEEHRLFYVAVTRAKESLDVLYARSRGGKKTAVSRFVRGIAPQTLPRMQDEALAQDQRRAAKRHVKRAQASLF